MNLVSTLLLGALLGFTGGTQGVVPAQPHAQLLPIEQNIVAKTNQERARNGRSPLVVDPQLMQSARQHAIWMARNQVMQHGHANVAENIAMGQNSSTEAIRDWMNSPGHRANMLNGSYTRIGVAAYRAPNGQVYWCQQFVR